MFGVYKLSSSEWMKKKLELIEDYEFYILNGNVAYKSMYEDRKSLVIKEIYDKLNEEYELFEPYVRLEFTRSGLQKITKYPYPIVSKLADVFCREGLFKKIGKDYIIDYNVACDKYGEPKYNSLILRSVGEGDNKEIVSVCIESRWYNKLDYIYKKVIMPMKHSLAEANNMLKIPEEKLKAIKTFDKYLAYEICVALSRGEITCNSREDAVVLDKMMRSCDITSDFLKRIKYLDNISAKVGLPQIKNCAQSIKKHLDYSSMLNDAFDTNTVRLNFELLIGFKSLYKELAKKSLRYLAECKAINNEKYNKIVSSVNNECLFVVLKENFPGINSCNEYFNEETFVYNYICKYGFNYFPTKICKYVKEYSFNESERRATIIAIAKDAGLY